MSIRINNNNIFITQGDTINIVFNITNDVNLSACNVVFVVKENPDDYDDNSLIYIEPKIDLDTGTFNIFIPSNRTNLPVGNYYWGFKIYETDGSDENIVFSSTPCIGKLYIEKGIIRKGTGEGEIDLDSLDQINKIIYELGPLVWSDSEYNHYCRNYYDILKVLIEIYNDLYAIYKKLIKIEGYSEYIEPLPDYTAFKTLDAINLVLDKIGNILRINYTFMQVIDYKSLLICFKDILSNIKNLNEKSDIVIANKA